MTIFDNNFSKLLGAQNYKYLKAMAETIINSQLNKWPLDSCSRLRWLFSFSEKVQIPQNIGNQAFVSLASLVFADISYKIIFEYLILCIYLIFISPFQIVIPWHDLDLNFSPFGFQMSKMPQMKKTVQDYAEELRHVVLSVLRGKVMAYGLYNHE